MSDLHLPDVSRETTEKLKALVALVEKWTIKINLISKASISEIWERHIVDSMQLFHLGKGGKHWVDLGSGGGFPGLVIAILADELDPEMSITLLESDQRKCAFLRAAIRELELPATVICQRIEAAEPLNADVLSARALADLTSLLEFAVLHLAPGGVAIFPKGKSWQIEDAAAHSRWSYRLEAIKSRTNPEAAILKIKDIVRV